MNIILKNLCTLGLICFSLILFSCGEDESNNRTNEQNNIQLQNQPSSQTPASQNNLTPPEVRDENGQIVYHYICPDNCERGGANMRGNCSICGKALLHNDRFHEFSQPPANNTPTAAGGQEIPAELQQQLQQQKQEAPAQNAAGVYHYTCPNGCAGGAGTEGTCSNCGSALTHNQAYHQ